MRPLWILGHEIAGLVAEVGKEIQGYQIGDRLAVPPPVYRGKCVFCRRDEYDLCLNMEEIAQHWRGDLLNTRQFPKKLYF